MTIIVENGTQVSNSVSYISLADFKTYGATINNQDYSTFSDAELTAFLLRAATYLDNHYEWKGTKVAQTQSMAWPRANVVDRDGFAIATTIVPKNVIDAQSALTIRFLANDLLGDITPEQNVIETSVDIAGAISERTRFDGVQRNRVIEVDMLLFGLVESRSSIKLIRA